MKRFSGFSEEDLIAYHLRELPRLRSWSLRRALERDPELAAESEAIAETLRVFRDAPTPAVNEAALERSWSRVRSSLIVLPERPRRSLLRWSVLAGGSLAAVVLAVMLLPLARHQSTPPADRTGSASGQSPLVAQAANVLAKLHGKRPPALVNHRPGPLTTAPVDAIAGDPAMGAYLDSAERLLTEVSHEQGSPSDETRTQVHRMLLQNAVFQRSAQDHGDLAAADVMDDLGRVLVSLDAEPQQSARGADAFRLQMNLGNVLFDLRILHRNPGTRSAE